MSAPDAKEARARPAVLAATVPKAAASFKPEAKAAIAICSPALIASSEETCRSLFDGFRTDAVLLGFRPGLERDALDKPISTTDLGVFKIGIVSGFRVVLSSRVSC